MRFYWSEVSGRTLRDLAAQFSADAKVVKSVTLEDLAATSPEASTGLYFFLEGDDWMYVGSSGSKALIERVPGHLDVRPEGWFGTLLQKLVEHGAASRAAALPRAFEMRLTVLVADEPVALLAAEKAFQHVLRPKLNSLTGICTATLDSTLAEISTPVASATAPAGAAGPADEAPGNPRRSPRSRP
ncbi:MAG: hypothetical protein NZL87_04695 [Thermomicrobium sp.]|nr:hypothetical protein [Thermomicrobium sp.]